MTDLGDLEALCPSIFIIPEVGLCESVAMARSLVEPFAQRAAYLSTFQEQKPPTRRTRSEKELGGGGGALCTTFQEHLSYLSRIKERDRKRTKKENNESGRRRRKPNQVGRE